MELNIQSLIRDTRRQRGLRQQDAAARIGWDQSRWSQYETGHRVPTVETLALMARALGARLCVDFVHDPSADA